MIFRCIDSVYFIRAREVGLVKIGRAKCPWRRLIGIQTSCPYWLEMVGILGPTELGFQRLSETGLHERFSEFRKRSEWFHERDELADFIKAKFKTVPTIPERRDEKDFDRFRDQYLKRAMSYTIS